MNRIQKLSQNIARKFINIADRGNGTGGQSFISRWFNPPAWDTLKALEEYKGYVFTCVQAIAEEVAKIDITVNRRLANGDLMPVPNHPFIQLLRKPNPMMNKFQLIEITIIHNLMVGDSFWYMALGEATGRPKALYPMRPDLVDVVVDENTGLVSGYLYRRNVANNIPLELNEVFQHSTANPLNPYRGIGVVEAGAVYVDTEQLTSRFSRNFIYNNAAPSGIVNLKGTITAEEFDKFKRLWRESYGGVDNAGKTAFLRQGEAEFTKIGISLGDIDMQSLKNLSREDIMSMFRVSKPILGITDDVNRANAEAAEFIFAKRVIEPKMMRLADALNNLLKERWGDEFEIDFESPVPDDVTTRIDRYTRGLDSWLTINDIRDEEGLAPIEGGDFLRRPLNLIEIGEPMENKARSKEIGKITITKTKTVKAVPKKKELDVETKENFRVSLMRQQEKFEGIFRKSVNKILNKQLAEVKSKLGSRKALEEFMFDENEAIKVFREDLTPVQLELLNEQGKIALLIAGADDLNFEIREDIKKKVSDSLDRMAKEFNDDTIDKLKTTLTEGIAEGESLAKLSGRINSVYSDAKGYRSERIARSETLKASNGAAEEAYKQTGYVVAKEWYANPDACEFCDEMDGRVVGIDTEYQSLDSSLTGVDGGQYDFNYESIDYPPLHPNCRCAILPVRQSQL